MHDGAEEKEASFSRQDSSEYPDVLRCKKSALQPQLLCDFECVNAEPRSTAEHQEQRTNVAETELPPEKQMLRPNRGKYQHEQNFRASE